MSNRKLVLLAVFLTSMTFLFGLLVAIGEPPPQLVIPVKAAASGLTTPQSPGHSSLLSGNWQIEVIDSGGDTGRQPSLALDSAGYPHISYYYEEIPNGDLRYAYQDATGWYTQTVDDVLDAGSGSSIALDSSDSPHISYMQWPTADLMYAYWNGTSWIIEKVDIIAMGPTSLGLDANDYPHISYAGQVDLKYAHRDITGWYSETVDGGGWVGDYSSLAVDGGDNPHISYHDDWNDRLNYAFLDATGWHTETVEGEVGSGLGRYTSLALDQSGYPHISYHISHSGNGDLRYAYLDATGWHTVTVDSLGDVGLYTSLALDRAGYPHISYYDWTNGDLKYAYQDTAGWHVAVIDAEADVGVGTSLALDDCDLPHIGYHDWTNHDLKHAYIAPYINLDPHLQAGAGMPGTAITFTVNLRNQTGMSDTFDITLGTHNWATALYTSTIGPLACGESQTFTATVTVPVNAVLGDSDTIDIVVTSISRPAEYTTTARLIAQAALSPMIQVDTVVDDIALNGNCTLREAVIAGNTNTAVDKCPAVKGEATIMLPAGTYTLTLPGLEENEARMGDLDILANLTIRGTGSGTTIIDGNELDRVFHIDPNHNTNLVVQLYDLTVQNGWSQYAFFRGDGGGILNNGNLQIENVDISQNKAIEGGGIYNNGTITLTRGAVVTNSLQCAPGPACRAGGIANAGSIIITESQLNGNTSPLAGAIFNTGEARISDSTMYANNAGNGSGIYHEGEGNLVISNTMVVGNTGDMALSLNASATLFNVTIADNDGGVQITTGSLTVTNSIIYSNGWNLAVWGGATAEVTYSDIEGGHPGIGNIDINPRFVDPSVNDYHLLAWSPAIDVGTAIGAPDHDFEGDPRPQNAGFDMGADEFVGTPIPLNRLHLPVIRKNP